ncbi:MAG: ABC transporter substrate-binding protein [Deltaproteobacteria bacterium]|nr:ABC transporter substrate-binding protein [Deltaproteobacteria bacterium]
MIRKPPSYRAIKRLSYRAIKLSSYCLYILLLTAYCLLPTNHALSQELTPFAEGIKSPTHAIGVILPLRGEYATFGEEVLKGVLLAARVFGEGGGYPLEVLVKDSGESPSIAAKAVENLASDERVVGIVGPLLSVTALEAARKAQGLKVPIIVLSQREDLRQVGDYVFRNSLTPSSQTRAITRYALDILKLKRFAILYPENPYGQGLASLFREEVRARGGQVVMEGSYQEGQTDFGGVIKRLFKIKETEKREGRRHIKTFEPTVSVDALYIPDYFDTVSIIASHLAYYNVKGIQLLGTNGWNSSQLVELGGRYVEGAVFVDGFFPYSPRQEVRTFVEGFRSTYGVEPGILGAQAYDAMKMFVQLIEEGGKDRKGMREGLAKVKDFRGATGTINFEGGEARKELFILTVRDGKIVQLN